MMAEAHVHDLNKPKSLADKLCAHWHEAKAHHEEARDRAREDRRFYDGVQWDAKQKAEMERQGRPALVINHIHKAVNNLLGRERDSRLDWKALPRGNSDILGADARTKALKYIQDQTRSKYLISQCFEDSTKGPQGWAEIGYDDTDPHREPIFIRRIDPFEMWLDPYSRELDLSDARYLIKARWVDLDIAQQAFPEKAEELEKAVAAEKSREAGGNYKKNDDYGNRSGRGAEFGEPDWCDCERLRVRLREHWYWEMVAGTFITYPDGRVYDYDPTNPEHVLGLAYEPGAALKSGTKKQFYYAVMAGKTLLHNDKSPYPFARFPHVALWAYRTDEGEAYGAIRQMKDSQKELNVTRSRLNESVRSRWLVFEEGALGKTTEEQATAKLARSNFVLKVAKKDKIELGSDKTDAALWAQLMETARTEIDEVTGLNEAAYGDSGNEKSGKAIQARVAQQGLTNAVLFDHLRLFRLQLGEMALSLVATFYEPEKLARIIEATILQEGGGGQDLSWVTEVVTTAFDQTRYDVVLEDVAETTTERQMAFQEHIDLVGMLPDPAKAALAPALIRMSDLPDKEEVAGLVEQVLSPMLGIIPPGMGGDPMMPPGAGPQMGPGMGGPMPLVPQMPPVQGQPPPGKLPHGMGGPEPLGPRMPIG